MFGKMNVVPVVDLRNAPDEDGRRLDSDEAVARLLDVTEHHHEMGPVPEGPVRVPRRCWGPRIWRLLRLRPPCEDLVLGGL